MSGTSLELSYIDRTAPILSAMQRVMRAGQRTRPLTRSIGAYLVRSTQNRFDAQESPEGVPWEEVSAARMAVKRIQKVLTESSRLRDSIHDNVSDTTIEWGTDVIYARIHQEGGKTKPHDIRPTHAKGLMFAGLSHPVKVVHHPGSEMPARPYLGISDEDEHEILERIHDYYHRAVAG